MILKISNYYEIGTRKRTYSTCVANLPIQDAVSRLIEL